MFTFHEQYEVAHAVHVCVCDRLRLASRSRQRQGGQFAAARRVCGLREDTTTGTWLQPSARVRVLWWVLDAWRKRRAAAQATVRPAACSCGLRVVSPGDDNGVEGFLARCRLRLRAAGHPPRRGEGLETEPCGLRAAVAGCGTSAQERGTGGRRVRLWAVQGQFQAASVL